jgi:hypothetical protein
MPKFSKFVRPGTPSPGVTSDRDLDCIEAILRYRFSPTSELVRLVGGHEDVTQRRLRKLWERQLVNRFAFPGIPNHGEFIYYLDNRPALNLLVQYQRLTEIHPQMDEELRLNREADYACAVLRGEHMKLGFLRHSLMISRLHFMLEMASRNSQGEIELAAWHQGAELRGHKVEVPEIKSRRVAGGNNYSWEESDNLVRLPVEPDAMFSLRFPRRPGAQQFSHFCYEADRATMPMADMLKKFRAYHQFIKRQQRHKEAFGVHPIRSVLVETSTETRARRLMELVNDPLVSGKGRRVGLFWFTISELLSAPLSGSTGLQEPTYLYEPGLIVKNVCLLLDASLNVSVDAENSNIVQS